jgi:RimJ/RimL family protein N-acetyltransferase
MRHDFRLQGFTFGLRPVELSDAEFIVELRTNDLERTRYLHPIPPEVQKQREWIEHYFARENDYYWVIERLASHQQEGLAGIYDLNSVERTAEWGRWVLRPGSLAAAESALLIYRVAFECLKLKSVHCLTVADNQRVVSFHDSCGLSRAEILKAHFKLGETSLDVVRHILMQQEWETVRNRLAAHAQRIARRLN